MKYIKNNFTIKFVLILFVVSIFLGLLTFISYKPDFSNYLIEFKDSILSTNQNVFLYNISIITIILILSVSIVGLPAIIFYLFYEGFSLGYTLALFIVTYQIKGFIFYLLFLLTSKLLYILIISYFIIMCLKFIKKFIECIISKDKDFFYKTITYHFYRYVILVLILIVNSTFIYFFSNKILKLIINIL